MPVYIEANEKGTGLYLKYGLNEVDRVDVDLELWGGEKGTRSIYRLLYKTA
jgi:hypothetical protein